MNCLRTIRRGLGYGLILGVVAVGVVVGFTGDFGLMQRVLGGVEQRALAGRSTLADRLGLKLLYSSLLVGGWVRYPQAAHLLYHYCHGQGDTLRFDARPLLQNPEVQQALRQRKPGITFRHQPTAGSPFYVVARTDWALYYAFDLLYIRQGPSGVVFYDHYFFQPLRRRSYTRFQLGKVRFQLNDGLIHVAYPKARPFVAAGSYQSSKGHQANITDN